jgi:hypothetical protein
MRDSEMDAETDIIEAIAESFVEEIYCSLAKKTEPVGSNLFPAAGSDAAYCRPRTH